MTAIEIIGIAAAIFILKALVGIGTGYYWKPTFQILSKLLNTSVEYIVPAFPLLMKINGKYKNRKVNCSFNALFLSSSRTITIAMTPLRELPAEPIFMVSYKKPTENTARQGNRIVYTIDTRAPKTKEYAEKELTAILEELTEATEKMEQPHV